MRITFDLSGCGTDEPIAMPTFDDAAAAVSWMRLCMQFDPRAGAILTRRAAADFMGKYFDQLDDLPFQLVREIDPVDGDPDAGGALSFTSVEPDDVDTIHDSLPCRAEIREFVRQYECWQLWMR